MALGGLEGAEAAPLLESYIEDIETRLAGLPPPLAGAPAYRDLRERLDGADIFRGIKESFTNALLESLPALREQALGFGDPLAAALRAATWSNLIDVAQGAPIPTVPALLETLFRPLALDETAAFSHLAAGSRNIVVFGDNAGETVLDRLFMEMLPPGPRVTYMVRPLPVMNDATVLDAEEAGIGGLASVAVTGLDAPTASLDLAEPAARRALEEADLILSKGQGNLEGLLGTIDDRLYYSFAVKCDVISDVTGLPRGSGVFAGSRMLPGWRR